jgi:hypothetical protein
METKDAGRRDVSALSEGLGAGAGARITFKFDCFNERRAMRGAEAASLVVDDKDDPDGPCMLWMSKADVGRNMMAFGRDPALVQAWDAYEAYESKPKMRGFGVTITPGGARNWYVGADGVKRWANNDQPTDASA